jgi:hypothetical protein
LDRSVTPEPEEKLNARSRGQAKRNVPIPIGPLIMKAIIRAPRSTIIFDAPMLILKSLKIPSIMLSRGPELPLAATR